MNSPTASAAKVLASHGSKLHTHEMHIRRGTKGGYIAKHDLRDNNGRMPQDGQMSDAEYPLADHAAMMAHIGEHMAPMQDEEEAPETPGA